MSQYLRQNRKKVSLLISIGLVLALILKHTLKSKWNIFISDIFFCLAFIFIIYGLWNFVLGVGFFDGFLFGARALRDLIYDKKDDVDYIDEDYLEFRERRSKKRDIGLPLFIGGILLALSILFPIII